MLLFTAKIRIIFELEKQTFKKLFKFVSPNFVIEQESMFFLFYCSCGLFRKYSKENMLRTVLRKQKTAFRAITGVVFL